MAEENESPADNASQPDETSLTRRSRAPRTMIRRPMTGRATRVASAPKLRREKARPLRSLVILAMVGGLIATVALPAYGAWRSPAEAAVTLEQVAADDAQSLVVASDATSEQLERGTYSATTPDEIATKKAEEAAAARAKAAAAAAAAAPARGASPDEPLDDGSRVRRGALAGLELHLRVATTSSVRRTGRTTMAST